ncbi:MAG TPA: 2-hydroxyacyl-CoA dehydratase family protein [Candidatus Deferrimicrobium sp.]|nr:2-hydroxyacyl-CoA dehydratase family protein [Candidatus Deferrimicrobium sp.]
MKDRIKPYEVFYHAINLTVEMIDRIVPSNEQVAMRSFLHNASTVIGRYLEEAKEGKPIIGYHFALPGEIAQAFDAIPLCFEAVSYLLAALFPNGAEYFYDRIHQFGSPYHSCTSQKGLMGMYLENLADFDVVVCPTAPCDNTIASYQFFSNHAKVPLLIADMPYYRTKEAYQFFANELMDQITEMGKILKQEPDWDKFKTAVKNSNQAQEYLIEINEMRRHVPSPIESIINLLITGATVVLSGTPEKAQFFKEVRDLMRNRIKNHQSRVGEEKFRSLWPNISLFYDPALYEWMDRELGMTYLLDVFNYYFYDPIYSDKTDEIILGLAKQCMNYPMTHQAQSFIDVMVEDTLWAAKEYKADCAIMTGHLGCKQIASAIQLIREILRDTLDIPMLTIEVDIGDKRFTSIETVKYEIAEFAKTLL